MLIKDRLRGTRLYGPMKAAQEATPAHREMKARRRHFYRQFVTPGSLCFDIGANMGNRTEIFLDLGATVIAVEPQQVCVRSLKSRFPITDRLVVLPMGVGAQPGTAPIYECSVHILTTMSPDTLANPLSGSATFAAAREVRVTTLDDLIGVFGPPAFVKIDVEGYESEILRGTHQPVHALSFEYNPSYVANLHECLGLLGALGDYEFRFSRGESMAFTSPWTTAADVVAQLPADSFGDVYARLRTEVGGRR
jgi:FkbM family methyltransferase